MYSEVKAIFVLMHDNLLLQTHSSDITKQETDLTIGM